MIRRAALLPQNAVGAGGGEAGEGGVRACGRESVGRGKARLRTRTPLNGV